MPMSTRRQFLRWLGLLAAAPVLGPRFNLNKALAKTPASQAALIDLYVARDGTPVTNVQAAINLAGGIQRFIDQDDVVILKPNGQWPNQGYTHTQSMKALIDVILNRPGGFNGEIIIAEHVHRDPTTAMGTSYCWNMSAGNRVNNWPNMNYLELVADYHNRGIPIVTADPLYDSGQGTWAAVTGPAGVAAGKQGWVHRNYTTMANSRTIQLAYPILRSSTSDKLIDLKNGVWQAGSYTGQKVKTIFLPTLNNHGSLNWEDYAGPTSALKCHLGIQDFNVAGGTNSLHGVGYNDPISPQAMGESVGQLITQLIKPAFYLTCAEYTGYRGRTDSTAAHTKVVGLCADPVTLDYWMCKYIMFLCATSQNFMNPDNNNHLRQALVGCQSKGVGTIDESQIAVHQYTTVQDKHFFMPLIRG